MNSNIFKLIIVIEKEGGEMLGKKKDVKEIKQLKEKVEELSKMCEIHKEQLITHEQMLIKAAKIIDAMDKTMGPVYSYYTKEMEKEKLERDSKIYG